MSENHINQVSESEISIKNLIYLLLDSWKNILATGFLGLFGAAWFVATTSNEYQVSAIIQVVDVTPGSGTAATVNADYVSLIMLRSRLPNAYSSDDINACGLQDAKQPAESLVNAVKLYPIKGLGSLIEIKVRMKSRDQAIICTQRMFDKIYDLQTAALKPHIDDAKALLVDSQIRLKKIQASLHFADSSGMAFSAVYLNNRDEIRFLNDEIKRLKSFITSSDIQKVKMLVPLYASEVPVFPKKKITLVIGLLAGLSLGILLVMLRKTWGGYWAHT